MPPKRKFNVVEKLPAKKAPSEKQLAARKKFTEMVRAKKKRPKLVPVREAPAVPKAKAETAFAESGTPAERTAFRDRIKALHPTGRLSINMTDAPVMSSLFKRLDKSKIQHVKEMAKLIRATLKSRGTRPNKKKPIPSGENLEMTSMPSITKTAMAYPIPLVKIKKIYDSYVKSQQ